MRCRRLGNQRQTVCARPALFQQMDQRSFLLFDLIDERALTKGELRDFCVLLFGTEYEAIPDPVVDWKGFISYVQERLNQEGTFCISDPCKI